MNDAFDALRALHTADKVIQRDFTTTRRQPSTASAMADDYDGRELIQAHRLRVSQGARVLHTPEIT